MRLLPCFGETVLAPRGQHAVLAFHHQFLFEYLMLTLIEISERYGLARGEEVVVPATYDAVWPLLGAFWGIRAGNLFGVLAADGSEICPCVLPATYWGFAQLQVDEALGAAMETHDTFIEYVQANLIGLHGHVDHTVLFQPAKWYAETVTPFLDDERGELCLYSPNRCLVLTKDGSWSWREDIPYPCVAPLVCATSSPVTFSEILPHAFREFLEANIWDMTYWRLKLTTHKDREPTEEEIIELWNWSPPYPMPQL